MPDLTPITAFLVALASAIGAVVTLIKTIWPKRGDNGGNGSSPTKG